MASENNESSTSLNTSLTSLSLNDVEMSTSSTPKPKSQSETIEKPSAEPVVSTKKKIGIPLRLLPAHNVPEMILFCLDTCSDSDCTSFELGDGSKYPPLYMMKRTIEIYVQNKNFIDAQHEFALLTMSGKDVKWVQQFTNNTRDIISSLAEITESEPEEVFDMSLLLESIWKNVTLPKQNNDLNIPPAYVVRVILLYNRSYCIPVVKKDQKELLTNPYCTIDVVITHEEPASTNKCQEIFDVLQQIDDKGYSYYFAVGRNPTALHDAMAKLLAHPLQRPAQIQAYYKADLPKKE